MGGQEVGFLRGVCPRAEVDVVAGQHHSSELRVRVGVLHSAPAADQGARASGRGKQTGGCDRERLRPRGRTQRAVLAHQRRGDAVADGRVGERPPTFVAVPLLVDLGIVTGQAAQHFPAPMIGALGASGSAVLAHAWAGHQVERAGPEPVGGAGQRPDRADLHGVAREVGLERFVGGDAHLLQRAAFEQFDERVTGNLGRKARAPRAQHTAFPVQQYLRGDVDRFRVGPFDVGEPGLGTPVGHGLVLQRAFAALVADRAVQRMVDQQEFHDAALRLVGCFRAELRAHHHVGCDGRGARGQRFALAFDLDQALPACADRIEQGMVAEPGNLNAHQLRGPDHQRALGNTDLVPVDRQRHHLDRRGVLGGFSQRHACLLSCRESHREQTGRYPKCPHPGYLRVCSREKSSTHPPLRSPSTSTRADRTDNHRPGAPGTRHGSA